MQRRHEGQLQASEMGRVFRRVESVARQDRVRYEDVRRSLGQKAVVDMHPFHMDTFKPGRTQFHTLEVRNFDYVTGSNPVHSTQL